jgi:glucosylceramidase
MLQQKHFKLSYDTQERFLEAYYDKDQGIGYTLGRTTIHSCDFSSSSYTYIEEGDKDLSSFSIKYDRKRIPFIKRQLRLQVVN